MPRIIDDDFVDEYINKLDDTTDTATSILTLNLILDILLGSSLKLMWGMVNTLQFICYFSETKLSLSATTMVFLKKLKIIALGEFIPTEEITSFLQK